MSEQDIFKNKYVICRKCGEEMEYKDCYAEEHLKKYPTHKSYTIIT